MPEQTNFVLFFDEVNDIPSVDIVVETLMQNSSVWLKQPTQLLLLNYETNETALEQWGTSSLLTRPMLETEILTIYATAEADQAIINNLSITSAKNIIVYTISIVQDHLLSYPLDFVENWIINLFESVRNHVSPVLFAGSEIDWEETWETKQKVIDNALRPVKHSYWIMADNKHLPATHEGFNIVQERNDASLLRGVGILAAIGFQL